MGFDVECIVNPETVQRELYCSLCRQLVYPAEAQQAGCGHIFCHPCITYIIGTSQTCSQDGRSLSQADVKTLQEANTSLHGTLGKILVRCLFHKSGCIWQGELSASPGHTASCSYGSSPVQCNRCLQQIMHRQVQEHAHTCTGHAQQAVAQQASTAQYYQQGAAEQAGTEQYSNAAAHQGNTAQVQQQGQPQTGGHEQMQIQTQTQTQSQAQVQPTGQQQTVPDGYTAEQWYYHQCQQYYQQYQEYQQYQQQYEQYQQQYQQYQQQQQQQQQQQSATALQQPALPQAVVQAPAALHQSAPSIMPQTQHVLQQQQPAMQVSQQQIHQQPLQVAQQQQMQVPQQQQMTQHVQLPQQMQMMQQPVQISQRQQMPMPAPQQVLPLQSQQQQQQQAPMQQQMTPALQQQVGHAHQHQSTHMQQQPHHHVQQPPANVLHRPPVQQSSLPQQHQSATTYQQYYGHPQNPQVSQQQQLPQEQRQLEHYWGQYQQQAGWNQYHGHSGQTGGPERNIHHQQFPAPPYAAPMHGPNWHESKHGHVAAGNVQLPQHMYPQPQAAHNSAAQRPLLSTPGHQGASQLHTKPHETGPIANGAPQLAQHMQKLQSGGQTQHQIVLAQPGKISSSNDSLLEKDNKPVECDNNNGAVAFKSQGDQSEVAVEKESPTPDGTVSLATLIQQQQGPNNQEGKDAVTDGKRMPSEEVAASLSSQALQVSSAQVPFVPPSQGVAATPPSSQVAVASAQNGQSLDSSDQGHGSVASIQLPHASSSQGTPVSSLQGPSAKGQHLPQVASSKHMLDLQSHPNQQARPTTLQPQLAPLPRPQRMPAPMQHKPIQPFPNSQAPPYLHPPSDSMHHGPPPHGQSGRRPPNVPGLLQPSFMNPLSGRRPGSPHIMPGPGGRRPDMLEMYPKEFSGQEGSFSPERSFLHQSGRFPQHQKERINFTSSALPPDARTPLSNGAQQRGQAEMKKQDLDAFPPLDASKLHSKDGVGSMGPMADFKGPFINREKADKGRQSDISSLAKSDFDMRASIEMKGPPKLSFFSEQQDYLLQPNRPGRFSSSDALGRHLALSSQPPRVPHMPEHEPFGLFSPGGRPRPDFSRDHMPHRPEFGPDMMEPMLDHRGMELEHLGPWPPRRRSSPQLREMGPGFTSGHGMRPIGDMGRLAPGDDPRGRMMGSRLDVIEPSLLSDMRPPSPGRRPPGHFGPMGSGLPPRHLMPDQNFFGRPEHGPFGFPRQEAPNGGVHMHSFHEGDFDTMDLGRKRKLAESSVWCKICQIDCFSVEGLQRHSQSADHQKMAMKMVLNIKQETSKKQKQKPDELKGTMENGRRVK